MADKTELITCRLQELLHGIASRTPIKQAIIALEKGDRSFSWIVSTGETDSDGTQMQEETPFFIASIDKMFNATIVMKLVEDGQLSLDDTITTYLPGTITRGLHRTGTIDYSEQITVRQLLAHTSGLADWLEDYPKGGQSLVDQVIDKGDMTLTIEDMAAVVRDHLKPHFPPQDPSEKQPKVRYSDTNYMLIIAIIEAVTGQLLHKVHEQLLFKPLGLRHTYFAGHSQPGGLRIPHLPARYHWF